MIRSMSLMPDTEGSATINTMLTPLSEAIAGHPMHGDPSMIASSVSGSREDSMRFFTSVTSFPDVPLPILS